MSVDLTLAPEKMHHEALELSPIEGKLIAVRCDQRDERKTRFGQRRMTLVSIFVTGEKIPLVGILFQSYFQDLELNRFYVGVLTRQDVGINRVWTLDSSKVAQKDLKALSASISAYETAAAKGAE